MGSISTSPQISKDSAPQNLKGYEVNEDFIRTALDQVDINALRLTLCQLKRKPELDAMPLMRIEFVGGMVMGYALTDEDQAIVPHEALQYFL